MARRHEQWPEPSQIQKQDGPTGNELAASPFCISGTKAPNSAPAGMILLSELNHHSRRSYGNALSGTSRPTRRERHEFPLANPHILHATATVGYGAYLTSGGTYPYGGQVTVQRIFTKAGTNIFNNFLYSAQPVTEFNPASRCMSMARSTPQAIST